MEEILKKDSRKKIKSESKSSSSLTSKVNLKTSLKTNLQINPTSPKKVKEPATKASTKSLNLKNKTNKNLFTNKNSLSLFANSLADEKWGQIQKDMSKAISHWDEVTKKFDGKPNRDDQQMQEIKKLLKDLQKKLTNFG